MRTFTSWMLIASIALANTIVASANVPQSEAPQFSNAELTADGVLAGQLLNSAGQPIANAEVTVRSQTDLSKIAATIRTDSNGRFAVADLKNGICVIDASDESFAVRVWQHGIAPPGSLESVALVSDDAVTRGQQSRGGPLSGITNKLTNLTAKQKLCLGLAVAAAIIIPIALDDDDDAS